MVILYQSQTLPINPPGASPVLTIDQFWQVMILKCRKPELFVAPMSGSEVLEETETFIKRTVMFKEGMGPPSGKATEEITLHRPWKADFMNPTSGAFISNLVSQGEDPTDLYLTFYFEWQYPNLQEGSKETRDMEEKLWGMAKETVKHTIGYARGMAERGELKGS